MTKTGDRLPSHPLEGHDQGPGHWTWLYWTAVICEDLFLVGLAALLMSVVLAAPAI